MRQRRKRRKYSPQFKLEAVRMVESSNRAPSEVAKELGIPTTTLEGWLGPSDPPVVELPASQRPPESDELARLRRENERLRMERDFLKKAAAFFANDSK
jgi:transposase-like protein